MGKKKEKHVEDEAKHKQAKQTEDECKQSDGAEDAEAVGDPAHADEEQDIALIKKLIAEHLGDDHEEMGEAESKTYHELAKEAYEGFKQMGYSEEEAQAAAGHALKLAKHMAAKQSESEAESHEGDDAPKKDDKAAADKDAGDDADATESEADESESKESMKKTIKSLEQKLLESQGALAALKLTLSKGDVERYVETKLAESKKPKALTKAFREAAGKITSREDFDKKWTLFCEGIANSRVAVDFGSMFVEKGPASEDGKAGGVSLDFSGCAD